MIEVSGLKRVGLVNSLVSLALLPGSFFQSSAIISRFKPDVVVGVGGYASGPMVMGARLRGVPTAVLEQNSIPGFTNKVLGKVVERIFGTFDGASKFFPAKKYVRLGNPVRQAIVSRSSDTGEGILILGGSQGARALNESLPGALKAAFEKTAAVPVTHQTGEKDVDSTRAAYAAAGVNANVTAFIDDMGAAYAAARLCICRAGATTCSELTALGKASILIPFPFAADDHQTFNARELQDKGAAVLVPQSECNPEKLGGTIASLLGNQAQLDAMAAAAKSLGKPRAASDIADALYAMANQPVSGVTSGVHP